MPYKILPLLLLPLAACPSKDTSAPSPSGDDDDTIGDDDDTVGDDDDTTETGSVPTGDTATVTGPSVISASCEPTDNPLRFSCTVSVDPPQPVQIRFSKSDGTGISRVHTSEDAASEHTVGLYMMAPETDYDFTAETLVPGDSTASGSLTTGALPVPPPVMTVTGTSAVPYVGLHTPCLNPAATAQIFDTATGELLWYQEVDPTPSLGLRHMLRFTEDHTVLADTANAIVEVDLMGNELFRSTVGVDFSEGLHHDLNKKDGLIYALFEEPGDPIMDGFHVFDASGPPMMSWYSSDFFTPPGGVIGSWMHTNTIWIDPSGDVLLSLYNFATVIKVDGDLSSPSFGELIWAMSGDGSDDLGDDFEIDWSLVEQGDLFQRQHDVKLMPDGRMLMLDNHLGRALAISFDEVAMTATVDASYASPEFVCGPQGTAGYAAGHVFVGCDVPTLLEYDDTGTVVWEITAACDAAEASITRWYPLEGW